MSQELASHQLAALVRVYDFLIALADENELSTLVEGHQYRLNDQLLTATFNTASGHWELLEQVGPEQMTRFMVAPDGKLMPVALDERTGWWTIEPEPSRWTINDLQPNFNQL